MSFKCSSIQHDAYCVNCGRHVYLVIDKLYTARPLVLCQPNIFCIQSMVRPNQDILPTSNLSSKNGKFWLQKTMMAMTVLPNSVQGICTFVWVFFVCQLIDYFFFAVLIHLNAVSI